MTSSYVKPSRTTEPTIEPTTDSTDESVDILPEVSEQETYLRDLTDVQGIRDCYDKYGVVGIKGVLNSQECEESVQECISVLKTMGADQKLSIDDPETYYMASPYLNSHGVVGREPIMTKILNRNRLHPNVKRAYSIIFGMNDNELLAQFDRMGWMRSNIGVDGTYTGKFATPFYSPGVHLDVDPTHYFEKERFPAVKEYLNSIPYTEVSHLFNENNVKNIMMGRQCQGVLNLIDNDHSDGGFQFVEAGHQVCSRWFEENKNRIDVGKPNGQYAFDKRDHQMTHTKRLPCPAGTLIVFDVALPHGTRPNRSSINRMAQFLRYMPKKDFDPKVLKKRRNLIRRLCKDDPRILNERDVI